MSYNNNFMYDAYHGEQSNLNRIRQRCGFSIQDAADYCLTSVPTFNRWLREDSANPTALRLLAIRAGLFPWDGWEMHNGYLFPPGFTKNGVLPGKIQSVVFLKQLLQEQRKTTQRLENRSINAKIFNIG